VKPIAARVNAVVAVQRRAAAHEVREPVEAKRRRNLAQDELVREGVLQSQRQAWAAVAYRTFVLGADFKRQGTSRRRRPPAARALPMMPAMRRSKMRGTTAT